jgi:thiamine biosynthesis lipoprotein
MSPETVRVLETAARVSEDTGGALDITVYPAVKAWGFTVPGGARVPQEDALRELAPLVGYRNVSLDGRSVTLRGGAEIDLGALAKGYASQMAVDILARGGVTSGIVSLGGNVQALGSKPDGSPWNVAIQDPEDMSAYAGILRISNRAVVTSGVYQRYFEHDGRRYHHIIDPSTLRPADSGLLSATVISDDGTLADALSTALMVMGRRGAEDYWRARGRDFDMILITESGEEVITEGIKDDYTPSGGRELIVARG